MSKVYFNHTTKLDVVKFGLVPAATIALTKVDDKFYYGVSICSKYDNFSKKFGREVAQNRLEQGFGVLEVPDIVKELPEKQQCLAMLYNLSATIVLKNRKWKKKITKFNLGQKLPQGKIISFESSYPDHSSNQQPRA